MRDGTLRFDVEEGVIKSVAVGSGLGTVYQDLYTAARDDLEASEHKVEAAVRLVVFGCFLLEARINETVKAVLLQTFEQLQVAEALWEAVERQPFRMKLHVLVGMTPGIEPGTYEDVPVQRLFDLRNRLAHFKSDLAEVEVPLPRGVPDVDQLASIFLDIPEADLIRTLKSDDMDVFATAVEDLDRLLDQINDEHFNLERTRFDEEGAANGA